MATWNCSKRFEFTDTEGIKGRVGWTYHTTSDILTLETDSDSGSAYMHEVKAEHHEHLLGFDEATATLKAMLDWDARYNDARILRSYLQELVAEKEKE